MKLALSEDAPNDLVLTTELPVSVRGFYDSFLADSAPFNLVDFHTSSGDWDVSACLAWLTL